MHSNLDDVLEHYATPSAEYSSWSAQNHTVSTSSRKKTELHSRGGAPASKNSSVSPLLSTGSRSSVSHNTHSFLGKYGVALPKSQQGDTSSTYWLKRLGMIETAASENGCVRTSKVMNPKRASSPSPAAAHRRSSSSRRLSSAQKAHRSSMRMADAEKKPAQKAGAGAGSEGAREAFVAETVARAVAKLHADVANRAVDGESLESDSALMRQMLLGPQHPPPREAGAGASDCGSNYESAGRLRSGECTPASAVSYHGLSHPASCSENGDSWSVASGTSSFSILSGLNIGVEVEERDRARGGAQGYGYATVLLMSDEEDEEDAVAA